ncbi:MAG: efflux RND transporter periplasmic adaptor subunit [Desulfopila sp.]
MTCEKKCFAGRLTLLVVCFCLSFSAALAREQPPAKVVVDTVVAKEVAENQSVIGVLYYERTSQISTEVAGLVTAINVVEGQTVAKGDVLLQLDTEILEREIALTRTRIEQIDLRIDNAERNFERLAEIYEQSGVSEKVYDDADYAYRDAVKEKQATRDTLQKLLIQKKRSVIPAPFDGIVLSKNTDVGGWVRQGGRVVTIGSSADLYVRAPIAEKMLQFVDIGEEVSVTINAFDKKVTGRVINIDPVADIKTKNVFVKINIPHQPLVAENMSATVYLSSGPKQKLSIIKRAALVKNQGKNFIYTVKEGRAAIMPVTVVAYLGDRVAVSDPSIVPGMQVIIEGNERLRPDQAVAVAGE